ncbi:wax ester/triacylglycerol synthase family O-acyltransferase [Streptomyces sp. ASQP_92]|uniref:wax ester/triacylglycerol synthase family O-acyltransferase n=1 Tax=Streptomyces sp. ASQP_92 TaxID=2979116 RepID=UPI0021BF14C7|nr:wax ester/triacylglycerol synthase family O-acyltransferase [Streptomyces sp. ASQP_92]MCT9091619.1 wax ester/triacylglycerol synthase family O-acyltransferase [Streptomyces sp. ASQP_92]
MLEWARQRPHDGYVVGATLRLRGSLPSPHRLRALISTRLPGLPVLAEYLDGLPWQEAWRGFESFDAAAHVHVLTGTADPRRGAEIATNQPIKDDQPRWGLWLLDSERDGEYLLSYRVHHAAQDGAAVAHTIRKLLDTRAPAPPAFVQPREHAPRPWATAPSAREDRLLATADVPVDTMRAVVQASGASLNDIYLAALAGALRAWLPPTERAQPVPVRVPFTVRLRHERQDRGNRMGHLRLTLPVDEKSALRRLACVTEQTRSWPRDQIRRILDRAPHPLLWQHIEPSLSPGDALASATMLGLPTSLAFDGSPVIGGIALPPLAAGHVFSAVLFLYGTRATVSFTARKERQDVRALPSLWEHALGELAGAVRP